MIPYVNCFGRTVLYVCIEYCIYVNMYHAGAQGFDERMINVHYCYYDCGDGGSRDSPVLTHFGVRSFYQMCKWQVTAENACTLRVCLYMK